MRFNANTTRQNKFKMARACNKLFVLVNEDNVSELMGFFNAENTKRQKNTPFLVCTNLIYSFHMRTKFQLH